MKNLITKLKYAFYALLVTVLITACESEYIPEAPYIVTQIKICNNCKAKYKYWVKSMNSPKRTTEIITDQSFMIGDTLRFSK
tara:strand:+ start:385 stop:630 length:246 start_codon:yes stop_codon:yes gene_type:complete